MSAGPRMGCIIESQGQLPQGKTVFPASELFLFPQS